MRYRILLIILFLSALSGQSLFNRWVGTDPFMGSPRSTAMGNTHLLNSTGSSNVRFNPANLGNMKMKRGFDIQLNRSSVFERWSVLTKDNFGGFLNHADYVANEFSFYGISLGLFGSTKLPGIGIAGMGFHYGPLTHFNYQYSEEVRGSNSIDDGEYAGKDPIMGYQNLSTDGLLMLTSIGGGVNLDFLRDIDMRIGCAINLIQSTELTDRVEVDTLTLYSVDSNLTALPDFNAVTELPTAEFITFSANLNLNSNINLGASWENDAIVTSSQHYWEIDSTNGLFQYWNDTSFVVSGLNYLKPDSKSLALSFSSDLENMMSIDLEINQISFNGHHNFQNYKQFKFGFEYLTQLGTPIRGGLVYRTAFIPAMKPVSMFTFGSGKSIGHLEIEYAGTYCFQSFNYPDLFPVEGDIRSEYDLVRDSQLHLQLAVNYKF